MKERTAELDYNKESQRKFRKASDIYIFFYLYVRYIFIISNIYVYIFVNIKQIQHMKTSA